MEGCTAADNGGLYSRTWRRSLPPTALSFGHFSGCRHVPVDYLSALCAGLSVWCWRLHRGWSGLWRRLSLSLADSWRLLSIQCLLTCPFGGGFGTSRVAEGTYVIRSAVTSADQ
ncbi:hypothetical protein ACOMHN_056644 [Nucella lapillus]